MSSVCLSARLWRWSIVVGWNSFIISSPGMFALCRPKHPGSTPRGTPPKFWPKVTHSPVDLSVGDIRSQSAAEWLQLTASGTVIMESLDHHRSFEWGHRWPPTTSPSPKWGVPYAPKIRDMAISPQRVMLYTSRLVLGSSLGRWIEWRHFWWHQNIQVGDRPPSWIISNGHNRHISATAHSIHL